MSDDHDCLDHLVFHQEYHSENMDPNVDNAVETRWEEWWSCRICGECLTQGEVTRLLNERGELKK
jgi:hypothetical protein